MFEAKVTAKAMTFLQCWQMANTCLMQTLLLH